jgi:hypothetical protein
MGRGHLERRDWQQASPAPARVTLAGMNTLPPPDRRFSGQWEPPSEQRRTWRRPLPSGGYEYRDTPPQEHSPASPEQPPTQSQTRALETTAAKTVTATPVTQQQLAASAATMPADWPHDDAEETDEFAMPLTDPEDAATHAKLMQTYEKKRNHYALHNIPTNDAEKYLAVANAFHAMSRGVWDDDYSPNAAGATIETFGLTPFAQTMVERFHQHEKEHFEQTYFDSETAEQRSEKAFEFLKESTAFFADLTHDTQSAMLEDLAYTLSKDKDQLESAFVEGFGEGVDSPLFQAAVSAAGSHSQPPLVPTRKMDDYGPWRMVDTSTLDDTQRKHLDAYLTLAPKLGIFTSPTHVVVDSSIAPEFLDSIGTDNDLDWTEDDDMHGLFNSLPSPRQIGADKAPLSARNSGNVAGGGATGAEAIESDWDSNDHDVYKRLSPGLFLVKRGQSTDTESAYELITTKKAPPLTRLPDAYWEGFDENEYGQDGDKVESAENRKVKQTKQASSGAKIVAAKTKLRSLRQEHDRLISQSHITQAIRDKDERMHNKADDLTAMGYSDLMDEDAYTSEQDQGWVAPPDDHYQAVGKLIEILESPPAGPEHVVDYDDYTQEPSEHASLSQDENETDNRDDFADNLDTDNKRLEKDIKSLRGIVPVEHDKVKADSDSYRKLMASHVQRVRAQIEVVKNLLGDKAQAFDDIESTLHKLDLMASPRRKPKGIRNEQ